MTTAIRCKSRRESAGKEPHDLARTLGVSSACIHDLETYDSELGTVYSLHWAKVYATELGATLNELLGLPERPDARHVSHLGLAISEHCVNAKMTLDQFGESVGWEVQQLVNEPSRTAELLSFDALADICTGLGRSPEDFLGGDGARA